MRRALEDRLPLIWFQGFDSGLYLPIFPVYLVDEEEADQQFVVALDDLQAAQWRSGLVVDSGAQRRYAQQVVDRRLHQPLFRSRVLAAYEQRCAICRLHHIELLDAAHIQADGDGGAPVVPNGMAMCKLHHAAYDAHMLGIDADLRVHIRPDLLAEEDGPVLRYAIQELHLSTLTVPRSRAARPDRDLLGARFHRFLQRAG